MMLHAFGPPSGDGDPSSGFDRIILVFIVALIATILLRLAGA